MSQTFVKSGSSQKNSVFNQAEYGGKLLKLWTMVNYGSKLMKLLTVHVSKLTC